MLITEDFYSGPGEVWRSSIESVEMPGDFTAKIGFFRPVDGFLSRVSVEHNLVMLSSAQWRSEVEDGTRAFGSAGNVPYRILGGEPGDSIRFARVGDHLRQTLNFEELIISFFNLKTTSTPDTLTAPGERSSYWLKLEFSPT